MRTFVALVVAVALIGQLIEVRAFKSTYELKGFSVKNIPDAMNVFIKHQRAPEKNCESLALILDELNDPDLTDLKIVEILNENPAALQSRYSQINVGNLAENFLAAIKDYINSKSFDAGAMKLIQCLKPLHLASNYYVRVFMSRDDVNQLTKQYEIISSKKFSIVTDPENNKLSQDLSYDSLHPAMQDYLLRLFINDKERMMKLFASAKDPVSQMKNGIRKLYEVYEQTKGKFYPWYRCTVYQSFVQDVELSVDEITIELKPNSNNNGGNDKFPPPDMGSKDIEDLREHFSAAVECAEENKKELNLPGKFIEDLKDCLGQFPTTAVSE